MHFLRSAVLLAVLAFGAPALAQTNPGTSPLSGAKGGTNNAFMQFSGPATSLKTFTLPNASGTVGVLNAIATWTAVQSFSDGTLVLLGSSSGSSTIKAPATGGGTATLFTGSDTITGLAATQTLTNKTISGASNNLIVRIANDVTGLGANVATALGNAANGAGGFDVVNGTSTLTNKTFNTGSNTFQYPATSTATSTMGCGAGSLTGGTTATWHYWNFGKVVYFNVTGTPTFTSCTNSLSIPLPNSWVGATYGQGSAGSNTSNGQLLAGTVFSGGTSLVIFKYDGTFPLAASGQSFNINGTLEIQ